MLRARLELVATEVHIRGSRSGRVEIVYVAAPVTAFHVTLMVLPVEEVHAADAQFPVRTNGAATAAKAATTRGQ